MLFNLEELILRSILYSTESIIHGSLISTILRKEFNLNYTINTIYSGLERLLAKDLVYITIVNCQANGRAIRSYSLTTKGYETLGSIDLVREKFSNRMISKKASRY